MQGNGGTMTKFTIGDVVRVRPGVLHPQRKFEIGGWHGRIKRRIDDEEGNVYFFIHWDAPTIKQIPDEQLLYMFDVGVPWRRGVLPASSLLPAEPRDEPGDAADAIKAVERDLLADDPLYGDAGIAGWGAAERDEEPLDTFFDADRVLDVLEIPPEEHEVVHEALAAGLGRYIQDYYGYYRYGKRPYFALPSFFAQHYPFGYGVLSVLDDDAISRSTRRAIAHFAIQTIDPFARDAIPYGVAEILSFLAAGDDLDPDLFRSVFVALELAGEKKRFDGWERESAVALSDWLLAHPGISPEEKIWWLWHFALHFKDYYHLGKDLIPYWLAHPELPPAQRRRLAEAWFYNEGPVGRPPANWRLMQATFAGDTEAVEALTAEMGIEEALDVDEETVLADMAKAPHVPPMPDPHETTGNDPVGFFNMLMGMRFGGRRRIPAYVRRLAVPAMVGLADDPADPLREALGMDEVQDREQLGRGAAEALQMFREQIPEAERRELVEMGIEIGLARARRDFYALGAAWFGPEYMQRAAEDEAASVRRWAAKRREEKGR